MNGAGWSGMCSEYLSGSFTRKRPLRKSLGSKERLDWLKIDLNTAEIITVQEEKRTKNVNGTTNIRC